MNHELNQFIIRFNGNLPSAQSNQLVEELRRSLGTIPESLQVERLKEDPDSLDEGSALLIFIATVAIGIHSPQTMTEALAAAMLVEFAYRHGAELQIENKLGEIFHVAKDVSHEALEKVKKQLQEFLKK